MLRRYLFILVGFFVLMQAFFSHLSSDTGPNHRERQQRPIRLGTSGGSAADITKRFCCGGTLGALVRDSFGNLFILSNNHVIANNDEGHVGDPIIQPGLIDINCNVRRAEPVAALSRWVTIQFNRSNTVDGAIAQILSGRVNRQGRIIDVGIPGPPREAAIGLPVKKSGRTSGLTVGVITALNVNVRVEIPKECGSKKGRTARFTDQFVVESTTRRPFVDGGDSGSLIVQQTKTCPRSVGLLFAGDDEGSAIGNGIQNVLRSLNVSIVGCIGSVTADQANRPEELTLAHPLVVHALAVQSRNEERLFQIPGVVGIGLGMQNRNSSEVALVVFARKQSGNIPLKIENLPVRIVRTSGFRAL